MVTPSHNANQLPTSDSSADSDFGQSKLRTYCTACKARHLFNSHSSAARKNHRLHQLHQIVLNHLLVTLPIIQIQITLLSLPIMAPIALLTIPGGGIPLSVILSQASSLILGKEWFLAHLQVTGDRVRGCHIMRPVKP